jgi:hypothetical protein
VISEMEQKQSPQVFHDENPEKPVPHYTRTDYSGAHEKTDPKEIALVRKLDKWIMVSLLLTYS